MPERHDHGKNLVGKVRIELCAKSFILQVYEILARHNLRDLANRFLLYGEKHSLDDAWRRLAELFRQVPLVLGNRASGFTLEGVPKSWDEVSERADHIIQVCNDAEAQASGEIPADYGT
jgi:hypothetical protein